MPITVNHELTATTPDNPNYEIRPSHWNSTHAVTLSAAGTEIIGAFSNANNVSFGTNPSGFVTATATFPGGGGGVALSGAGSSVSTGTVVFSNSNNVSFGMNGSTITATASALATQSNQAASASNGSFAFQTLGFSNANNVTFGTSAGSIISASVAAQTNQTIGVYNTSNTTGASTSSTYDARSLSFVGYGIISVGQSNGSIQISAPDSTTGAAGGPGGIQAGTQTATSGTVVFSNSNGVTFGMSNNSVITASVVGGGGGGVGFGVSTAGNTAGSTGTVTTGNVVLVGSGPISLSQSTGGAGSAATITILGPPTSSLSATGAVSLSSNGSTISIGVPVVSHGISGGNTAGNTGTVSNQLVLAGAANITLSGSTNAAGMTVSIAGGAGGGGGAALSAGTQSGNTGTIVFSNSNGLTFGMSNSSIITGSYTVPTQTNQTAGIYASSQTFGQSSSSTHDARSLSVVGSGGVSVGWSNSSLLISGQTTTPQTNQTIGIYGSSQTTGSASSSTYDARSLSIIGAGGISVGNASTSAGGTTTGIIISGPIVSSLSATGALSISTNGGTISIGAPAFSAGVSTGGNTIGNTGTFSNQLVLAGGNNITLSGSTAAGGMTVTISGAAAGGAQTGISGVIVSNTTYTSGTISFSNANGISFGSSAGQAITASYTVPTQSVQSLGLYGSSQTFGQSSSSTYDARSLSVVGSGGVSVGWSNSSLLISGQTTTPQTVQTQASGAIAGSGFTSAGNNIGLSGTHNSAGLSLSATVAAQTNQSLGIYASSQTFGQSSSSTYDARSLSVVGSGGVSVGWSNSSLLISGQTTAAQTVQTQASGAIAGSGFTSAGNNIGLSGTHNSAGLSLSATVAAQTNQTLGIYASSQTFGQSSSSTHDARSLSVVGSGIISVGWSNSSLLISAAAGAAQTAISGIVVSNTTYTSGTVSFSNANGISFGSSAGQAITASYTVPTVTQYFSNTATTFNGANISGSMTHNTAGLNLSLSVAAPGAGGGVAVSIGGNSTSAGAGYSNITSGTAFFLGGPNITLSQNGASISISAPNPGAAAEANWINLLGANTAGSTTVSGSTLGFSGVNMTLSGTNNSQLVFSVPATSSIVGTNGVSISSNGSTISVSGVPTYTAQTYQNRQLGASSGMVPGQNSLWIAPMRLVAPVNASTGIHMISITGSVTSNQTNTVGVTWQGAIYQATGTNTSRLDTVFSTQMAFTFWNSGTASVSYSYDVTSSSSAGSNLMTASVYGNRMLTFNIGSTFDPGFYAWAFRQSTSSAGNSSVLRSFNAVMDNPYSQGQGFIGSATNATLGYADAGIYSVTTGAIPASIGLSEIRQNLNQTPFFKMGAL